MDKPKINPTLRAFDIILEAIAGIILLFIVFQFIIEYPGLSDQVVTHFDARGNPDTLGHKSFLFILPVVSIIMYAGLTILNRFPYLFNYPVAITADNAFKQYQLAKSLIIGLKTCIIGMFAYIQHKTIEVTIGQSSGLGIFFIAGVMSLTFIPIIVYFILARKAK